MGLSEHRRHRCEFGEKTLKLFVLIPWRYVLETLDIKRPRSRALSHGPNEDLFELLWIFGSWSHQPVVKVSFLPEVLWRYEHAAADTKIFCDRDRPIGGVTIERDVHAPAAPEERLVLARPSLAAVDTAGGNTGQQYAQRIWDPLA